MPKKKEKKTKKGDRGASTSKGYGASPPSSASTTASEAQTFPSRTQQREKEKVKKEAKARGVEHLVHTQHHHVPKASKEGAKIKGHRAAVFYGPEPGKRRDDPGSKGNDIQYEVRNGHVKPTRDAQKSVEASKNHNHVTRQELKKASRARRPEKLVDNAVNGWEKKNDKYQKKPVSMFSAFTACFGGGSSRSSSSSRKEQNKTEKKPKKRGPKR